jgi:hypothetical protein
MDAPSQRENFNHPREIGFAFHGAGTNTLSILRINPPKFGGGLKFEPVDKSRLSGTPGLRKWERFAKVSIVFTYYYTPYPPTLTFLRI